MWQNYRQCKKEGLYVPGQLIWLAIIYCHNWHTHTLWLLNILPVWQEFQLVVAVQTLVGGIIPIFRTGARHYEWKIFNSVLESVIQDLFSKYLILLFPLSLPQDIEICIRYPQSWHTETPFPLGIPQFVCICPRRKLSCLHRFLYDKSRKGCTHMLAMYWSPPLSAARRHFM